MAIQKQKTYTKTKRPFKKRHMKAKKGNNELIVYHSPKLPFPPRYRTTVMTSSFGHVPLGSSNGAYQVLLNECNLPYAGSPPPSSAYTLSTLNCMGLSSLLNANFYQQYRVYGSSIEWEMIPENILDTVVSCVVPTANNSSGSPPGPAVLTTAINQPFAKSADFSGYKVADKKVIRNSITVHKLLGVSPKAIQDDLSEKFIGAYNSSPGFVATWDISWATQDTVVTSSAIKWKMTIKYHVEFFNPYAGQTLDT